MAPSPPPGPHKAKPRKGSEKSPRKSETWEECATSKSKLQIALVIVKPNKSQGVKPLRIVTRQELEDETPKATIPKVPLPFKVVLGEGPYANDEATSNTFHEYDDFEITCDEYVQIFNELMRPRRATQCFDILLKIFNNSYTFKKRGILSTLGAFKPKNGKGMQG